MPRRATAFFTDESAPDSAPEYYEVVYKGATADDLTEMGKK